MHGFKVRAYLDTSNETRRLMWTLAHAHGIGLALVHIAFGLMLRIVPNRAPRNLPLTSTALVAAGVLLPGGFFLRGTCVYGGEPGDWIALGPFFAAALFYAVFTIATAISGSEWMARRPKV